jgi:hypothetical protein
VAAVARVRRAQSHRQIGSRDANAMVVSGVDFHVRRVGHVTRRALRSRTSSRVKVVGWRVERGRPMTPGARSIAGRAELLRMRVVTIRARHAGMVHPALEERAVVVDLVPLLSIREVETRQEQ